MLEIVAAAIGGMSVGFVGGVAYFFALARGNHITTIELKQPQVYKYRHKKRGSLYGIVGRARAQCSTQQINDGDLLVLYREKLSGEYSVRPPQEFFDGRFEDLPLEGAVR